MSKETGTPALIKMLSTLKEKLDYTYIAIIVLSVALYVGFDDLISGAASGTARDTISAALAAIFVLITTMYLLNKQTDIEQKKKLEEKIYINKFKIYDEVINVLQDIGYIEFKISDESYKKCLNKHFECEMVAPENIRNLSSNIQDFITDNYEVGKDNKLEGDDLRKIRKDLFEFTRLARKDLNISNDGKIDTTDATTEDNNKELEENIINNSGQKKTKIRFKGQIYNKRRLILGIVNYAIKEQKIKTFEELIRLFPDHDSTEGKPSNKKCNFVVKLKCDYAGDAHRVFGKTEDLIKLDNEDEDEVIVHNQWGGKNFDYFLKQVQEKLAYEFVEIAPEK